jgi:hypothetical protein
MLNRELILHHDDLDGAASAAIVMHHAHWRRGGDVVARPIRYGENVQAVLDAMGDEFDRVFLVDWSPQGAGAIEALYERLGSRLVWIDHHAAAIQGYRASDGGLGGLINGVRMSEADGRPLAACELAWIYCWTPQIRETLAWPRWLTLIGDWDTWRHAKIPDSPAPDIKRYFDQFGIDEMREQLEALVNKTVLVDSQVLVFQAADERAVTQMVDVGRLFGRYERAQDAELMRARAFEATFDGIPAIIANQEFRGSMRFQSVYDQNRHRLMVGFAYDNTNVWAVSLYSEDPNIDCGVLCHRLGQAGPVGSGGGHRVTGGFQTSWDHLRSLIVRADGKLVF